MENLPQSGGALLLINHGSFLDPVLVGLPLTRPVSYLARDSLFRVPLLGWFLKNTCVMSINRKSASSSSIKESIRRIEDGFLVGLFPEGTRTSDGTVGPFKPGFLAISKRIQQPIYPVGIAGAFEALPRGCRFLRPGKIRVVFGKPIATADLEKYSSKGQSKELVQFIREQVIACQQEAQKWRDS